MRNFDEWLAQFRDSISNYRYYTDFEKVVANARALKAGRVSLVKCGILV